MSIASSRPSRSTGVLVEVGGIGRPVDALELGAGKPSQAAHQVAQGGAFVDVQPGQRIRFAWRAAYDRAPANGAEQGLARTYALSGRGVPLTRSEAPAATRAERDVRAA
jgi:hypothetical protein